ncbi:MAG: hypothetical protein LBD85_01405 [Oscillospiraceae bacterium]|jgi:Ni2+-binding GTPase involved in maturation of urease and hydrogenase|nr:hypothetical protein [Oscillospiraceae bacterium]
MKLITVSGPPSAGKTSVILRLAECLAGRLGVVKFDCLTSFDRETYESAGIPVKVGLSGKFCPDHFYVNNVDGAVEWGIRSGLDYLITESAGLCNRCSPHITGIMGVCVIDCLSGVRTPRKIGPMLRLADVVALTKGDIVSQAEREVFAWNVRQSNERAQIIFINGITGQGAFMLSKATEDARSVNTLSDARLRFTMPTAACAYCTGETRIGEPYQMGMMEKMSYDEYGEDEL